VTASASIPEPSSRAAPRTPTTITSPPGYVSLLVGRGLYSKATSTCQTPAGMLTLDQVVPALYAGNIAGEPVTRPGITLSANVTPDRTLATTTKCFSQNLYPSCADLSTSQDYLYALSKISSGVGITDPATLAESWGRIPTPFVEVSSTNPTTLNIRISLTRRLPEHSRLLRG
jgi:hypothetical protein